MNHGDCITIDSVHCSLLIVLGLGCRALRGGGWNNNQRNARVSDRNHNEPDNFNNNIGFRLVVAPDFYLVCRQSWSLRRAARRIKRQRSPIPVAS